MKKIKRIVLLLVCIIVVVSFASCGSKKPGDNAGTVKFESDNAAFEAMTGAALEGNFSDALRFYDSGAAGADDPDVLNWYYYSKAANDYQQKGCIGHSLDLLQNRIGTDFEQSDEIMGELQMAVRNFNGCYANGDYYVYFSDGKIAVGEFYQLTGRVVTNGEVVKKDGVYYWAEHDSNGDDNLLYTFAITESGNMEITPVEEAESSMYGGTYSYYATEMPVLVY